MNTTKPKAIVLTSGMYNEPYAKTAHGLVRGSDRFAIKAIIDHNYAGQDAGKLLDNINRDIPIYSNLEEALNLHANVDFLIIGVATHGGILPQEMLVIVEKAINLKLSIVNGLHEYLDSHPELVHLAQANDVKLIDLRKPKSISDLHFWTGEIYDVSCPIISVIGTDCAVGKRTTARLIKEASEESGLKVEMIYTGQTGWMQGGKYGFILDSTLNDFVGGELEHVLVSCWKETKPDIILIEGQAALRNPSGPCGTEYFISGNSKHVILVHPPKRKYYDDHEKWGEIPAVSSEIEIINNFGTEVICLMLNTEGCTEEESRAYQSAYREELGIPVILPLYDGVESIIPTIKKLIS